VFLLLLGISQTGCRNHCELVEMALRAREQDLRALKEELVRLQVENCGLKKELIDQHQSAWIPGGGPISPEYASQTYMLKRVTLGRGTGGYSETAKPWDDALQVVIEPRDSADDIIKAPGKVQITALEISPEGLKAPLSTWNISAEQLRNSWKQGFFSNGYVLVLPWQQMPKNKQVRVTIRFQLSDGRVFEADKDVTVIVGPMILPAPKGPIMIDPKAPIMTEPTWPGSLESLPIPKEKSGTMGNPPRPTGSNVHSTSNWQPASLNGAVKMLPPVPVHAKNTPPSSAE
jgi:hypothetical protein